VQDWYTPSYVSYSGQHNPQGPASGTEKSYRGKPVDDGWLFGGFDHIYRRHAKPTGETYDDGVPLPYVRHAVRCALNLNQPLPKGGQGAEKSTRAAGG
jgi:hypothetical protein